MAFNLLKSLALTTVWIVNLLISSNREESIYKVKGTLIKQQTSQQEQHN